jgi:hypothetical protein
MLQQVQVLQL